MTSTSSSKSRGSSLVHRVWQSRLLRSCWNSGSSSTTKNHPYELGVEDKAYGEVEGTNASTSLMESRAQTMTTTATTPETQQQQEDAEKRIDSGVKEENSTKEATPSNRQTPTRRKTLTLADKQKSDSQLERLVGSAITASDNLDLPTIREINRPVDGSISANCSPYRHANMGGMDHASSGCFDDSDSTSQSEGDSLFFETTGNPEQRYNGPKMVSQENGHDKKPSVVRSLADYLKSGEDESLDEAEDPTVDCELDDQMDGVRATTSVETARITEWDKYTSGAIEGLPTFEWRRRGEDQPYDDLVRHSLDDYSEHKEREWELAEFSKLHPDRLPVAGPSTREQSIRMAFCRVKRHNARSTLPNDTPQSYYFTKQIGEGAFSMVYRARRVRSQEEFAIKVMVKRQIARENKVQYVNREKDIMATLSYGYGKPHPFIARIHCTFQDADRLYYVMTLAENGELLMWLRRLGSFDLQVSRFYASEIVAALEYIHNCGIIHRDLKPENILIKSDWHLMISDFGSAKIIGYHGDAKTHLKTNPIKAVGQRSTFVGTTNYMAPEVAQTQPCGPESDFWALGAIIFQMISGMAPFRGLSDFQILRRINHVQYKFPEGFDETAKDLVQKLLVVEVEERLGRNGADEIKAHPFFEHIDWSHITERSPPELKPYVPASGDEPEFYSSIAVPGQQPAVQMEPGLHDATVKRLRAAMPANQRLAEIAMDASDLKPPSSKQAGKGAHKSNAAKTDAADPMLTGMEGICEEEINVENMTSKERLRRLMIQRKSHPFHSFVDDTLIVKCGLIDKKKGLFARRRMFLLTEDARLLYVDPINKVLKGEVPMSPAIKTEAKNFRTFFIHTPARTYYLFDPGRRAIHWCETIDRIRDRYFAIATEKDLARRQEAVRRKQIEVNRLRGKMAKTSVSQ